jgi:ribose transport system permease protein
VSELTRPEGAASAAPSSGSPAEPAASHDASAPAAEARRELWAKLARVGILALFVVMVVVFSALRPETFPTVDNLKAILQQAAVFAVLGAGLTVVLVIREFDLSFDANASITGAVAVSVMTSFSFPSGLGMLTAVLVGGLIGAANGLLVGYGRAPAFIGTLAIASVIAGVQTWFTGAETVFGVPDSYVGLSTDSLIGIPLFIWISVAAVLGVWILLKFTIFGRHAHAVGSNPVAAESAGIRTARVRFFAFVVLGGLAGLAGVLITSQQGGSAIGNAAGLLLPVYTAAFLGASAWGRGQFHPLATYFGVLFIGTLQTGLTMLQQPNWVAQVVTGAVLVAAVLVARRQ